MSAKLEKIQADKLRFIHITDTHLLNQADEVFNNINTRESFEKVIFQSLDKFPDAHFLLFTGDISQTGDIASYQQFKSVIEKIDIPTYCVPGNHDTPRHLKAIIPSCPTDSIATIELGGYSLVLINSWVQDSHQGVISSHNLLQLKDYLANCNAQFMVFAVHHPPVLIGSEWLDMLGLMNREEFLQVINKNPTEALLLCGHIHQELDIQQSKLRLLGTPSTCHQFEKNSQFMSIASTQSPAFRFIQLSGAEIVESTVHYVE